MNRFFRLASVVLYMLSLPVEAATFQFPLAPYEVTGYTFGQYVAGKGYHLGEDAHGTAGTAVYAAAHGQVIHAETHTDYGIAIVIHHDEDNVTTLYGHLRASGLAVSVGDLVAKGQFLGYLGDTSENGGYAPHLHFGIKDGGDPGYWVWFGYGSSTSGWHHPTGYIQNHSAPLAQVGQLPDGSFSQPVIDCYIRNGGAANVGSPADVGETLYVHRWAADQGWKQDFSGAGGGGITIHNINPHVGIAYWTHGTIWTNYVGPMLHGPLGPLGWPVSDEKSYTSPISGFHARYTLFESGAIYYHQDSGIRGNAFEVHGAIYTEYLCYRSKLGLPITDEFDAAPYPGGTTGRLNRFEGGDIYVISGNPNPARMVADSIRAIFEAKGGTSYYGFPYSEAYYWPAGTDGLRQDFDRGPIIIPPTNQVQPDLWIRNRGESDGGFIGDNIYNLDGTSQTKMQGVTAGHTAVNYVLFQNDGNIRDYFLITAPSGGDGWTVNYFNDLTNENITPYLTDGTHNASGWLEPQGTSLLVRIEITPDSTVTTDSIREVLLTVVSKTDSSKGDAVKAVARVYPSNLGDLNNDSLVNENDADLVLQYVFGERDDLMSAIQALASQVGFPDNPPDIRVAAWILSNCQPR